MLNIIMIDKIISHIFIYKISSFLNLDDKKNIKSTNIYFKNIINKKIYSHIGNILLHHLGYLKNDINDFKKDLKTFDMTYFLIVTNTLLSYGCFKSSKQKVFVTSSISNIKAGVLFRIIASNKDKCISMLKKNKKIFRKFKSNNNMYTNLGCRNNNMYIRRKLPFAYSLILADSICITY